MAEIVLIKRSDGTWCAATEADNDLANKYKVGAGVRFKPTKLKERSLKYHNMYFGGLLKLTLDYWEPVGGLVSAQEEAIIWKFSNYIARLSNSTGTNSVIAECTKEYIEQLETSRSVHITPPHKSIDMLHDWVVEKAGYYELIITPEGIRKRRHSINFNAMDSDKFHAFYKKAFNVCWSFVLSQRFESQEQVQNVVDQLSSMG
ncbi:hypothetical protein DMW20_12025 [Vibrio parahaemolyticus]|nr:hypothetical protein [Vibrio parahaemolyticus]